MSLVIDSSVAACWLLPDERSDLADRAMTAAFSDGADVPALFPAEVANTVAMAVRRRRVRLEQLAPGIAELARMPLRYDAEGPARALDSVLALALQHGLTVYDAAYLELAQRLQRPLATLDGDLARAAAARGVPLFPT